MKQQEPYLPLPFRGGNTIVKTVVSPFTDPVGNRAMITKVDYLTSKKKLVEGYTLFVKWEKK